MFFESDGAHLDSEAHVRRTRAAEVIGTRAAEVIGTRAARVIGTRAARVVATSSASDAVLEKSTLERAHVHFSLDDFRRRAEVQAGDRLQTPTRSERAARCDRFA
jgi:hypothetical protein